MRTIMEPKTLYNYDDLLLSENAKLKDRYIEKVRNEERPWWDDFILDEFKEQLQEIGFYKEEIYYQGFWSQGNGACFIGKIHFEDAVKWLGDDINKPSEELQEVIDPSESFELYQFSSRYCHENTVEVKFDEYFVDTIAIDEEINAIAKALLNKSRILMREFYQRLEKTYDDINSEEYILQEMLDQDLEIDSSGNVYYFEEALRDND